MFIICWGLKLFVFAASLVTTVKTKDTYDAEVSISPDVSQESFVGLGQESMQPKQAQAIWIKVVQKYGDAGSVPEEVLKQLGWIIRGIPPSDIRNITFSDIDTITVFGHYYNLNLPQLEALADQVLYNWGGKEPADYSYYDLIALRHILCGFRRREVERIHPSAYREAASGFASLKGCPTEVLQGLAALATSNDAFGDSQYWTSAQVRSVGCVLGGLSPTAISSIPPSAMDGLTANAVYCLSPDHFKSMSIDQLQSVRSAARAALSQEQRAALTKQKLNALDEDEDLSYQSRGDARDSFLCSGISIIYMVVVFNYLIMY